MMIMQHINLMAQNKDEARNKNTINQTGFRVVDADSHKPQEEQSDARLGMRPTPSSSGLAKNKSKSLKVGSIRKSDLGSQVPLDSYYVNDNNIATHSHTYTQ